MKPSVIYADPPYTDDQYSRFYHLFETIALYDTPQLSGHGRYRTDRFRTPFSVKSTSAEALNALASGISDLGSDLVLSYPTNGLIYQRGVDPEKILSLHFEKVDCLSTIEHSHSTFGASKGPSKHAVVEQLFFARH
ncbi:DNA adenine methylase [Lichenibacterium minor]|uniref:DNA adenine methylase n=1 Tax=Lichenibacterium minor TaxID=2316528 RepID=UPI003D17DD39